MEKFIGERFIGGQKKLCVHYVGESVVLSRYSKLDVLQKTLETYYHNLTDYIIIFA